MGAANRCRGCAGADVGALYQGCHWRSSCASSRISSPVVRANSAILGCGGGMIQLAWRFLDYQEESALAKWFRAGTEAALRLSQEDNRRPGAKALDCLVALRPRWRGRRR